MGKRFCRTRHLAAAIFLPGRKTASPRWRSAPSSSNRPRATIPWCSTALVARANRTGTGPRRRVEGPRPSPAGGFDDRGRFRPRIGRGDRDPGGRGVSGEASRGVAVGSGGPRPTGHPAIRQAECPGGIDPHVERFGGGGPLGRDHVLPRCRPICRTSCRPCKAA